MRGAEVSGVRTIEGSYVRRVLGATAGEVTLVIAALPESVYDLVSDVIRMGDWSPERRGGERLDGAAGPAVGAMLRGHNRIGAYRWSTTSVVVVADPPSEFAFTVSVRDRDSTRWGYRLEPSNGGTAVTESLRVRVGSLVLRGR